MSTLPVDRRVGRGFTLVEMLVVITIIGLLAGLAIPAVIVARTHVRNAAIAMDVKQLEMACQAYKEKFGEYPPDFSLISDTAGQNIVLRHLAKAFPRYTPGVAGGGTGWTGFVNDIASAKNGTTGGIDGASLTPQTALAFWLGGVPDPANSYLPSGFAADPSNPFQTPAQCASRISPFFDFDTTRLKPVSGSTLTLVSGTGVRTWVYWPQGAAGDQSTGAITYFRAENGAYTVTDSGGTLHYKDQQDSGDTGGGVVLAAYDTRTSNPTGSPAVVNWVNPTSVQIFSAGLDTKFGALATPTTTVPGLQFPTGENYVAPYTYDDITNFSGGKLESAMP